MGLATRLSGTALAGVLLIGAGPVVHPPLPAEPTPKAWAAAIAKVLPGPRLFQITHTMDGKTNEPAQYCMSAESVARQLESMSVIAKDSKLTEGCTQIVDRKPDGAVHVQWSCAKGSGFLGVGCKQTTDRRADGAVRTEMICDKAAGATPPLHMTMEADGQFKELRQRMEMVVDMVQPPRTLVSESRMVQAGDCPADLKPGEMRMADGTKIDMAAMFAGPTAKPAADRPAEPH